MNNLKAYFNKINFRINGSLFGFGTSPNYDWKIIFTITVILIVLVTTLNVFMFLKSQKGELSTSEQTAQGEDLALDLEKVRELNSYYKTKALEFNRIKRGGTVRIVDPSL